MGVIDEHIREVCIELWNTEDCNYVIYIYIRLLYILAGGSLNPPIQTYVGKEAPQPYSFTFTANVISTSPILTVTSSKDELNVTLNENKTQAQVIVLIWFSLTLVYLVCVHDHSRVEESVRVCQ